MKRSTVIGAGAAGALVAVAVVLAVVATATTSTRHSANQTPVISHSVVISPSPTPTPESSGNQSTALPTPVDSSGTSASGSPSATIPCTGELSQAQLKTHLSEGQAVHTVVQPFGCVTVYKIAPGDTLFDIAHTFSINGQYLTLYQWNQSVVGKDPNLIHPGQVVIVDPTGKVTAPQ